MFIILATYITQNNVHFQAERQGQLPREGGRRTDALLRRRLRRPRRPDGAARLRRHQVDQEEDLFSLIISNL